MDTHNSEIDRCLLLADDKKSTKKGELIEFLNGEEVRIVNKNQISYKESARFSFGNTISSGEDHSSKEKETKNSSNIFDNRKFTELNDKKKKIKRKGTGFVFKKPKGHKTPSVITK